MALSENRLPNGCMLTIINLPRDLMVPVLRDGFQVRQLTFHVVPGGERDFIGPKCWVNWEKTEIQQEKCGFPAWKKWGNKLTGKPLKPYLPLGCFPGSSFKSFRAVWNPKIYQTSTHHWIQSSCSKDSIFSSQRDQFIHQWIASPFPCVRSGPEALSMMLMLTSPSDWKRSLNWTQLPCAERNLAILCKSARSTIFLYY